MLDSIYYTNKLVPIPVEVLVRDLPYAIVQTTSGKRYSVLARRIIPLKHPSRKQCPSYASVSRFSTGEATPTIGKRTQPTRSDRIDQI